MTNAPTERHYDDEALIGLVQSDLADSDGHLSGCAACSEKLEAFRMIAEALGDASVWDERQLDPQPVASTIASLRACADRMTDEDQHAECYVSDLLGGPRESWAAKLRHHPEYRTAGVVRKLLETADRALDTMPPDAVEITALATDIAGHLDPADYPSDTVSRLRGAAWRDRAYALFYTGRYLDAERAIFTSERHFCDCLVSEYELARLGIVKTVILKASDRFHDAAVAAERAANILSGSGDVQRFASAQMARVNVLMAEGRFDDARLILTDLERSLRETAYFDTHARVLSNLGACARNSGRAEEAIHYFELAAALFETIGVVTEALRIRWNSALLVAEAGRFGDAEKRFTSLCKDFRDLGMTSEAALAGLDLAELLLATNRHEDVETICRSSIAAFERSGVSYSARALTALAYIREAAAQRTASPTLIRQVRNYIRSLPEQPNLLFAPSPSSLKPFGESG